MAGYHLFASGEVLTAANANGYLMNQTVMVFASAAARTSALSGVLAEGMASYRTDSHVLEYYNGSAWVTASVYAAPTLGSTSIGSGATVATVAMPAFKLWLLVILSDFCGSCHSVFPLSVQRLLRERHAHVLEQRHTFGIGLGGRCNADVHSLGLFNLVVVDLGEN